MRISADGWIGALSCRAARLIGLPQTLHLGCVRPGLKSSGDWVCSLPQRTHRYWRSLPAIDLHRQKTRPGGRVAKTG